MAAGHIVVVCFLIQQCS